MTITLYRPVGIKEYKLIKESGYKKFPPRLDWQPIFYPVMNQKYAEKIAKDWNTKDEFGGFCGLVTTFEVNRNFIEKYEVKNVGGFSHNELWIPSEDLISFNAEILGEIKIVNAFFGDEFDKDANQELITYFKLFK